MRSHIRRSQPAQELHYGSPVTIYVLARCRDFVQEGGATSELSKKAQDFIRLHIQTVWQLELLLLFKRNHYPLTVREASRCLYMTPLVIEPGLTHFVNAGILQKSGTEQFAYAPSGAVADAIDETARLYKERRTTVVNFIYSLPVPGRCDAVQNNSTD